MTPRLKASQYSSGELIHMARQAINNASTEREAFKRLFNVNFSFVQLCSTLNKRSIVGHHILTSFELVEIEEGLEKKELEALFLEVQKRYEEYLLEERDLAEA